MSIQPGSGQESDSVIVRGDFVVHDNAWAHYSFGQARALSVTNGPRSSWFTNRAGSGLFDVRLLARLDFHEVRHHRVDVEHSALANG